MKSKFHCICKTNNTELQILMNRAQDNKLPTEVNLSFNLTICPVVFSSSAKKYLYPTTNWGTKYSSSPLLHVNKSGLLEACEKYRPNGHWAQTQTKRDTEVVITWRELPM